MRPTTESRSPFRNDSGAAESSAADEMKGMLGENKQRNNFFKSVGGKLEAFYFCLR